MSEIPKNTESSNQFVLNIIEQALDELAYSNGISEHANGLETEINQLAYKIKTNKIDVSNAEEQAKDLLRKAKIIREIQDKKATLKLEPTPPENTNSDPDKQTAWYDQHSSWELENRETLNKIRKLEKVLTSGQGLFTILRNKLSGRKNS